ncbi:hypothetical protein [Erythrobacter sp. R86502]|uniref:hypothetical protein n=1 Tax=Erythrobacter sp. R86502 TaxID=3093846 RepID=UPI0036D3BC91
MAKRLLLLPLALLAGTSLSGCVAVAIPALAGSAMVGSRVLDDSEVAQAAAAVPAAAPTITAVPPAAPAPVAVPTAVPTPLRTPAPMPVAAPVPVPAPPRAPAQPPAPTALPAPAPVTPAAPSVLPAPAAAPAAYPDPSKPLAPGQSNFARFVRYAQASALGARDGADLLSAILSDPVALDGKRRRCAAGEQQVALIDLDPMGGVFDPPSAPKPQPGLILGLAVLREAGVEIAWMTDLSVNQSGAVRTALEQSGLDPRGEDIISLRRDESDTKQQRKDNLAGITCITAIAGDERSDFDGRYKYLRSPAAAAELEPVIGNGWFLIEPLLGQ